MRCPFCRAEDTKVNDSRPVSDGDQIRRRRECAACQARFTTYENAELRLPRVIKADGGREDFSEDKVRTGIHRALEKRPVPTDTVDAAISRIRRQLLTADAREVESRQIGEMVMSALEGIDHVAYVRFASVYRDFKDVGEFAAAVKSLSARRPQRQTDPVKPAHGS